MKYLLLFISTLLSAQITLEQISSKPPSRAKNFLIWQYLRQDITPQQATEAFSQIRDVDTRLFFAYAKKSGSKEIQYAADCMRAKTNELLNLNADCLQMAISPVKAAQFSKEQREVFLKKISLKQTQAYLEIMNSDKSEETLMRYKAGDVLKIMTDSGKKFRELNFNRDYSQKFINFLASSQKVSRLIDLAANYDSLDKLQNSLLQLEGSKLNFEGTFMLSLIALKHDKKDQALKLLELCKAKASSLPLYRDKTLFWQYLVTHDKHYLRTLSLSMDINIYTLYAKEVLNIEIQNYFTEEQPRLVNDEKDLKDPFVWLDIRKVISSAPRHNLFSLADKYTKQKLLPIKSMALERAYSYKMHGFIMPYTDYTSQFSKENRAFMYALMRQESHFIPSAISSSYALGLMQLMPFLIDALEKKMPQKIDTYNDLFDPQTNIEYAARHLKWLTSQLNHPLLRAYAYNAGLGFVREYLKTHSFSQGKYEPFMSMEAMSNVQTREYGKKVLANYVMYKRIMGENVSIVHLFDTLKEQKQTRRSAK